MRRLDPLTPDEARELDALERALAGEPVDPDLRELSQLVHDLRATAPEMTPAFAARLQRDVADGFPEPVERPVLRRPRRWVLLPAAGVLAAALIALVVVLGQRGGDDPSTLAIDRGPATAAKAPAGEAPAAAPEAAADSGATTADRQSAPERSSAAPAPSSAAAPAPAPRRRWSRPPPPPRPRPSPAPRARSSAA